VRRKIGILVLVFVAMILIPVGVSWYFSRPPRPSKPLPTANGYPLLVNAGALLRDLPRDFRLLNQQDLRGNVSRGIAALQMARTGLTMECQVPVEYSEAFLSNHIIAFKGLRVLGQTLMAEGRLAELENRPRDAMKCYLDVVRLGIVSAHGGLIADALLGQSNEAMGREFLQPMLTSLDSRSSSEVAETLQSLDALTEPWQEISERNEVFSRQVTSSLKYQLAGFSMATEPYVRLRWNEKTLTDQLERNRRLIIAFAARAYQLDHQQKPRSVGDLVPGYLKTIPQDPLTGNTMAWLP
jgi:hypothetical protein